MQTLTRTTDIHLLDGTPMAVRPGELIGIAGASGAGKTTLLHHLAAAQPGDGANCDVGYVPQDDIIHLELPLRRTLHHAAALRLGVAAGSTTADVVIDRVLEQLDLTHRSDVPVGNLSGGERKRASIAVELLSDPCAFYLDEPTSGLDPVTGASVLEQLRRLAETGTTVFVTTHAPTDLDSCDRVILLDRSGTVAFIGAPAEALARFGVSRMVDVYAHLEQDTTDARPRVRSGLSSLRREAKIGPFAQWRALTRRNVDLLTANRLTLAILLGSPTAVITMITLLFRADGFDGPSAGLTAVQLLNWVSFSSLFFGVTYGLLQVVTETPIVRRERIAGLNITAYLWAKVAILVPMLAVINVALVGVLVGFDRLPPLSGAQIAAMILTGTLISIAGLAMGLMASAVVQNPAQGTLALPGICFPQVLFAGASIPVSEMGTVGQWMSYLMVNRWGFESMGRTMQANQLVSESGGTGGFVESFTGPASFGIIIIGVVATAFFTQTIQVLHYRLDKTA